MLMTSPVVPEPLLLFEELLLEELLPLPLLLLCCEADPDDPVFLSPAEAENADAAKIAISITTKARRNEPFKPFITDLPFDRANANTARNQTFAPSTL